MKLGVLQGRLSPPENGQVQEFPTLWEKEFKRIDNIDFMVLENSKYKKYKFNHIEWIVTKKSFDNNPIFKKSVKKYSISSICADNLIDKNFHKMEFLEKNLKPICDVAMKNGIKNITIPLLEESSIMYEDDRVEFIKNITVFGKKYNKLVFSFEFECWPEQILEVVRKRKNFKITYDTGNITAFKKQKCGHGHFVDALYPYINNVHLKDRTVGGKSVEPGEGDTDFSEVFNKLIIHGYKGDFTLQTARGETGREVQTMIRHAKYFLNLSRMLKYLKNKPQLEKVNFF